MEWVEKLKFWTQRPIFNMCHILFYQLSASSKKKQPNRKLEITLLCPYFFELWFEYQPYTMSNHHNNNNNNKIDTLLINAGTVTVQMQNIELFICLVEVVSIQFHFGHKQIHTKWNDILFWK